VSPELDSGPGADGFPNAQRDPAGPEGIQIPVGVLAAVEALLNRYLALDPEGARGFEPIHGRIIGIEFRGLGARLTLVPGPDRLQVFGPYDATPDCSIRGTPLALLRMVTAERKESEIGPGGVEIEGDSTIAHELAKAFAGLDVDWEEQLSRLVGDPIAHPVGQFARGLAQWGRRTSDSLTSDLKEYLEEEAQLLPTRYELDAFLAEVDTLRDDVARLEARVERLARGRQDQPPQAPRPKARRTKGTGPAEAQ
jgi:ubiquinone biosynthesis protein UbiJ